MKKLKDILNESQHLSYKRMNVGEEEEKGMTNEEKREFLKAVSEYKKFGESIYRSGNLAEVYESIKNIVETAHKVTLEETGDWFDKVTVNRHMKSMNESFKVFSNTIKEVNTLQQRLESCYDEMGEVLGKYYEIKEGNEFGAARAKAIANGDSEFEVDGKKFPVKDVDKDDKENAKKFAKESVNEGKHDAMLDKVADVVKGASNFMNIGIALKKAGIKYDFSTGMMPMYKLDKYPIAILNKKYVDKGDREVGDVAIGLLESDGETFTAVNKKTGNVSTFKSKANRDAAVKSGTHSKKGGKAEPKSDPYGEADEKDFENALESDGFKWDAHDHGSSIFADDNGNEITVGPGKDKPFVVSGYDKDGNEIGVKDFNSKEEALAYTKKLTQKVAGKLKSEGKSLKLTDILKESHSKDALDTIARRMFGKSYSILTIDQAARVKARIGEVMEEGTSMKLTDIINESKYTVINPKNGNVMGAGMKDQAAKLSKKMGGEKKGYYVIPMSNAKKARRALEKFNFDLKNQKLHSMLGDLYYESTDESVNEGKHDAILDKLADIVKGAKSFMDIGKELKKNGIKYSFGTNMIPMYIIDKPAKIAILNNKYADGAERVVGDTAIGLMESLSEEAHSKDALDTTARRMFGKSYSRLTMDQAARVKAALKEIMEEGDSMKLMDIMNEGASTEEKRIVMMAVRKIAKYRNVDIKIAAGDVMRAAKELERDIQKGKVKK